MEERRMLVNLCYRMLGSIADAEDAVQETYARWYALPDQQRAAVVSQPGWLFTAASRICLDMLGSARSRRERYIGEWLPEPIPDPAKWTSQGSAETTTDPADRVTLDESVSMALLVVLESMTPAERVAFILHDVFRYTFVEIASIVGRTPQACRQLASSARRRVREAQTPAASTQQRAEMVAAFKVAWQTGDLAALIRLLAPAATAITDGGGQVSAALEPIHGAAAIARFFVDVLDRQPDLDVDETRVNGESGLIARAGKTTLAVVAFEIVGDRISHVWAVRNPEKLTAWCL